MLWPLHAYRIIPRSHPLRPLSTGVSCPVAEEKIARVSGAELDLFEQTLSLEIRGSEAERKRAKRYVECVMAQRVGPVTIDDSEEDDDLTVIQVPTEAVGFVTGSQGNFLRQVEEEWGTLMFFADFRGRDHGREVCAQERERETAARAREREARPERDHSQRDLAQSSLEGVCIRSLMPYRFATRTLAGGKHPFEQSEHSPPLSDGPSSGSCATSSEPLNLLNL